MREAEDVEECLRHLEVRASAVHGRGVFAARAIPSEVVVGSYGGRRCHADDAEQAALSEQVYVFGLSDGTWIDGAVGGNATRFINHSCKPNCVAVEVHCASGEVLGVDIHTLEPIAEGQELFLDYRLDIADCDPAFYACRCGVTACRGTMAAVP